MSGSKITFWKQMRGLLSTIKAAAGLMPTANLGTGTADATTVLRGDQTYSKVSLAMQANMATASVIYRKTAGSGAPESQTLATLKTDLDLTGTNSGDITINALATTTYTIAVGTTGTDVNVAASGSTITVHVPDASAAARGVVSTGAQTLAGLKTFGQVALVGLSDVITLDSQPFATQTQRQAVWRNTAGTAICWVEAGGGFVAGNQSFAVTSGFHCCMWASGLYGWQAAGVTGAAVPDTGTTRDGGAGIIGARVGTTAHTFRIYNTYTNGSNYERGNAGFISNVFTIGSYAAGTGTLRDIMFGVTGNKIGFLGTTAIAKPTTGFAAATFTANAGAAVNDASTFDGYTIGQIVAALRAFGLLT